MNHLVKEFNAALHSLRKRPGFVVGIVLTLSLTLGAFITMSALNYTLFLKPLPYPNQQQLFLADGERYDQGELKASGIHSYAGTVALYKNNDYFSQSAILFYDEQVVQDLAGQPKLNTTFSTPEVFSMLGSNMALGRYFDSEEGLGSTAAVAVISHHTWLENYAKRADILNQSISINDVSFKIIGVLNEQFIEPSLFIPGRTTQVWLPFEFNPRDNDSRQNGANGSSNIKLIGQLKVDKSQQEADQVLSNAMNTRFKDAVSTFSWGKNVSVRLKLKSFKDVIIGESSTTSLLLFAGAIALLLIACANISNLFLSRAAEKQRQYAIQATLGAQKKHILRNIFVESFILTGISAIFGLVITYFGFVLLQQHAQNYLARLDELSLTPLVCLFAIFVAFVLAAVFASIIVNLINYKSLNSILRTSGKGSGLQISKKMRNILIGVQVSLAATLLVINFTLLDKSVDVLQQPPGFDTENIVWVRLTGGTQEFNRDERIAFIDSIQPKLEQLPEVKQVSNAVFPPLTVNSWSSSLSDGLSDSAKQVLPNVNLIDEYYFSIFNLPLVEGRNFTTEEIRNSHKVLIVNETVAKQFSSTREIIGEKLYWEGNEEPYKVIGVIKDVFIPRNDNVAQMFTGRTTGMTFMINLYPNANLTKEKLESLFQNINRNLRIDSFVKIDDAYSDLLARDISIAAITTALAILTLLLAGLGIYGILSYSINLRTHELGVRMALGGSPKDILKLVISESSKPVVAGILSGCVLLLLIFLYFYQQSEFQYVTKLSAVTSTILLISAASFIACLVPLSKIIRSRPVASLRQ